ARRHVMLGAALLKDLRLLARDRAGLVFLTIAPVVVITVAGLSLASLYGADPRGTSAYLLPVADEDGGRIGETVRARLASESRVLVEEVADREAARDLVRRQVAGAALVIPAGTTAAVGRGEPAALLLYTDPVKYLEVANVRLLVEELRHGIEAAARARRPRPGAVRACRPGAQALARGGERSAPRRPRRRRATARRRRGRGQRRGCPIPRRARRHPRTAAELPRHAERAGAGLCRVARGRAGCSGPLRRPAAPTAGAARGAARARGPRRRPRGASPTGPADGTGSARRATARAGAAQA